MRHDLLALTLILLFAGLVPASAQVTGGGSTGGGGSSTDTNVTKFGGTALSTGTGAGGLGIPRVTLSNDSTIAATDTTVAATNLAAANDAITITIAGQVGIVFQLASGNTYSVSTNVVTAECTPDGTNWTSVQLTPWATGIDAPTTTITAAQVATTYATACPFGASQARVRLSTYSGTGLSSWTARATVGGFPNSLPTQCFNACTTPTTPVVSSANTAAAVTLEGVAGQRVCVQKIVVYATGATGAATLTIKDGSTNIRVDYGTIQLATLNVAWEDSGTPIFCGSSGNNVVIDIGAGGVGAITHTSVVADRA